MPKVKNRSNGIESNFTTESWNAIKDDRKWKRTFIVIEEDKPVAKPIEIRTEVPEKTEEKPAKAEAEPDPDNKPKAEAEVKAKAKKRVVKKPVAKPVDPID